MSDSDPAPASDRRAGGRYLACTMAAIVRADGEQRPALVHDLSESGALILVRTTKVGMGDEITLRVFVGEHSQEERVAQGRVVRVENVSPADSGPWLRRVGVQFAEPLTMEPTEIETFRRRAQRLGMNP